MSRTIVGRIIWKELRAQRSLWIGLACFVIAIQALLTVTFLHNGSRSGDLDASCGQMLLAAYLGATLYAIGIGAASFTEELEGNTATLLRTMPMTPFEVFAGKWGYGLASTGILFLVLVIAAGTCSLFASIQDQTRGVGGSGGSLRLFHGIDLSSALTLSWIGLLIPILFFAFCGLFSLLVSDALIAGVCGTVSTIVALTALSKVRGPKDPDLTLALQISVIAGALIVTDYWLTDLWLRRGTIFRSIVSTKRAANWTWLAQPLPGPVELLRLGNATTPWRRALQRLVWKESRQARPYFEITALAATVMAAPTIIDPDRRVLGNVSSWMVGLAAPLVIGVGAYHTEQKSGGDRFFGACGLATDGSWLVKHIVWIGLTFVICGYCLLIDHNGWQMSRENTRNFQSSFLFGFARSIARPAESLQSDPMRLGLVGVYTLLAYSIAQRLSFAVTKGILAFGFAMGGTLVACQIWAIFVARGISIWWTIAPIPAGLFAYTWMHTDRWQTQRLYSYRWSFIVAWLLLPLAGIFVATWLYWPFPRN